MSFNYLNFSAIISFNNACPRLSPFLIPVKLLLDQFIRVSMFCFVFTSLDISHLFILYLPSVYHPIIHFGWFPQIYLLAWFCFLLKYIFSLYLFLFSHGVNFFLLSWWEWAYFIFFLIYVVCIETKILIFHLFICLFVCFVPDESLLPSSTLSCAL